MHLPSLARFAALTSLATLLFMVLAPGCGRSSLEPETLDSGVVVPGTCGPETCPTGCCDAAGVCRTGADTRACGQLGGRCADCIAEGFAFCDAKGVCGRNVSRCGPEECPNGCCSTEGGRARCLAGTQAAACGTGGEACSDCQAEGRSCDPAARECSTGKCDATNCKGCCVGDKCLPGDDDLACGTAGGECASCASQGQTCEPSPTGAGGACEGTPTCGPANCGGCCNGTECVTGGDSTACGKGGAQCANCAAQGETCVPLGQPDERTCKAPVKCGPDNCPGCCVGDACVVATTPAACGKGGEACKACGASEQCNAGACVPAAACGPATCAGCCIGDVCAVGNQATACGFGGANCANCAGQGKVCQGGACEAPSCGPANCAGCCAGNTCVIGTQDNACGGGGAQCSDCTGANGVCQGRTCQPKCGPANCPGCCTAGNACAIGFADSACGEGGAACVNCNAMGSTCDALVSPRVCQNQQNTCPAPYPTCPAGVRTPVTPSTQGLCDDGDLAALQAACAGGPASGTCISAFQVLAATDAACAKCLAPFDVPFAQLSGLYRCVAPFVTNACNRSTGCAVDCSETSCDTCEPATQPQCRSQVNAGQCRPFVQQTGCVSPALGPGDLCNPASHGGTFGGWLRAVGDHFCGNGP